MCPVLLHIYGPVAINTFGLFIVIGIIIALFLAKKDPRKEYIITDDQMLNLMVGCVVAGILGARILFFILEPHQLTAWYDIFIFWQGNFTELGSVIAIVLFGLVYLRYHKIPILPLLDFASNYAPLVQAFSRIGCFFAGCCFGMPTMLPWAVMYTDHASLAPLHVWIHPTQLYSSALFFILFFALYSTRSFFTRPGQQFTLYIMGTSAIRFIIDFWRDDKVFYAAHHAITLYQWVALSLFVSACCGFLFTLRSGNK